MGNKGDAVPEGLIIVESPAKARTLKRFLGDRFDVLASMGHVRDLPGKEMGVEVEHGFKPHYEVVESRRKTINELSSATKKDRGNVILASDPDREGEAIAWHLAEVLKLTTPKRIEFHEITSEAVRKALESPREIDMRLVNAQQARRVVDRLVGFRLSPFLWSKVQKGIGAGRVSSVALRLVVDREEEIRKFVPVESWTVDVELSKLADERHFLARLNRPKSAPGGENETKLEVKTQAEADAIVSALEGATYRVLGVEKKRRTKSSYLPYITSTLQQDASSRLRFRPFNTMRIAQQLYEGVELGDEGPTGLITYMRTDSTRISAEAEAKVKALVRNRFGEKYVGGPRAAKSSPGAQDAHEAIRPAAVSRTPDSIRKHLTADQFKLYDLIWRRFAASRMAPAAYDQTQAEIEGGEYIFRATGSVLTFDGFYKVWERDENGETDLPDLAAGEDLQYHGIKPEQHFTQPPPRYSEATLIKELEQRGIGRPSTYAPIVETIKDHGYVEIKERRLHPTRIGEAVNAIMVDHFKVISDDDYTATLEKRLDEVERGNQEWVPVVSDFYGPLQKMLTAAEKAMPADTDEECPLCHEGHLVLKASRFGPFMGCSRYPECKYRANIGKDGKVREGPKVLDEPCPICGKPLVERRGRYGPFKSCSDYPKCPGPKGVKKAEKVEV